MCKICLKSAKKKTVACHWRRSGAFIAKFEHILHIAHVTADFEKANAGLKVGADGYNRNNYQEM